MTELKPCQNTRNLKHGVQMNYPELYNTWKTMIHRCENPKRVKFVDYGERGITVCEEWHNPQVFTEWALANGYSQGLQIDRINNNDGYNPNNCHFVTPKENSRNRRNTKYITINGETRCVAEWCETISISEFTIYWWYRTKGREYAEQRVMEVLNNGKTS